MAEHTSVVPTTPRFKIILVGSIAFILLAIAAGKHSPVQVYSATDAGLDIAVVDGIKKADRIPLATGTIRAAVVPHHLVASEAVALGIRAFAPSSPSLVVVMSPDHYGLCPKLLCTTHGKYKTFFGDVSISNTGVDELLTHPEFVAESDLFIGEHGVYSIIPFIKHYIPNAEIVPIAVSQKGRGNEEARSAVVAMLAKLLQPNSSVLVVSSDFSHYLPLRESNSIDVQTEQSFCSGNSKELLELKNPSQSDCPLCLWILHEEALLGGFWNPALMWHSNSAELLHDTSAKETTSHFTFTFSERPSDVMCPVEAASPH